MMKVEPKISGFILSGGESKRMRTDKAMLFFEGETLLGRSLRLIRPFCETIAISGQKPEYYLFNVEVVPDLFESCGPISGIFSSLKHSSTEWSLIVSVDVPYINDELIQYLVSQIISVDCIIPKHSGGIEPLIGLYNKKILPTVEKLINQGEYKLKNMLTILNTRYVDCNDLIDKHPKLFFNINRPEDYRSI